jgi:uncharacterized protein with PQ loop repeat
VSDVVLVSGWIATVLTTAFAWPQALRAWRMARGPGTDAISLSSTALMLQGGLLWTTYGALAPNGYVAAANASVTLAAAVILVACRARLGARARFGLALGPPIVAGLAALAGTTAVGLLGDVTVASMTLPQLARVWRSRAALHAVSPATYTLLAANAAAWIVHGAALGDGLVIAPNCVTLPASLAILWRARSAPPRSP